MKRTLIAMFAILVLISAALPAHADDIASAIVGVWKLESHIRKDVLSGKTLHLYGQNPTGHSVFTRGGYHAFVIVGDSRDAPTGANATDMERIDLFKGYGIGTFKIDGNKVLSRYDATWHQQWTNEDISAQAEINGDLLTLTTTPFTSQIDGVQIIVISTWKRIP